MRFGLSLVALLAGSSLAHAGAALDDDQKPARTTDVNASPDSLTTSQDKVEYGADLRIRSVWVPQSLVNLFVERSAGGIQNWGWGFDLVRRRGNLELQLGFEHENLPPPEGVWINKGDTVPGNSADYILSPDHAPGGSQLGWYTLEFTFMNHAPINKYVAFRYGGGAGLGIVSGALYRWDVQCAATATNSNPSPGCVPGDKISGGQGQTSSDGNGAPESAPVKYNLPPVFPVVNAIIGLQIKPTDKMVINIEGGIRTFPFFGFSGGYFF